MFALYTVQLTKNFLAASVPAFTHADLSLPLPNIVDRTPNEKLTVDILLAVVSEGEFLGVLRQLRPLPNRNGVVRVHHGTHTFMTGLFGVYASALVKQADEGVSNIQGAIVTIYDAISTWQPKATFMIGAALGLKPSEQQLGDVMVSSRLGSFSVENGVVKHGDYVVPSGRHLGPRFAVTDLLDWHFKRNNDGSDVKVHRGLLLGGPLNATNALALLASFRDQNVVGVDKEGEGVVTAAVSKSNEWIVVKGICGFVGAPLTKDHAAFAVAAAVSSLKHVLSRHCLSGLGCFDLSAAPPAAPAAQAPSITRKRL